MGDIVRRCVIGGGNSELFPQSREDLAGQKVNINDPHDHRKQPLQTFTKSCVETSPGFQLVNLISLYLCPGQETLQH